MIFEDSPQLKKPEKRLQRQIHFDAVEITPEQDFPFSIRVRKEPIEVVDGDKLGANYVEVFFRDETLALMKEAELLQELPEEERLVALIELVKSKLRYPYPEVITEA